MNMLLSRSIAIVVFALLNSQSFANEVIAFAVKPAQTTTGNQIRFTIVSLKESPSSTLWCGVVIDFGDGNSKQIRFGENGDKDLAYTLDYNYLRPGNYIATISGKAIIRGLKSVGSCQVSGNEKVNIKIISHEQDPQIKLTEPVAPINRNLTLNDCVPPVYPRASQRKGEEGEVELSFIVAGNGVATEVTVKKSSGFVSLDNAAITAIRNCKLSKLISESGSGSFSQKFIFRH